MEQQYTAEEVNLFFEVLNQEMSEHYLNFQMGLDSHMFEKLISTYKELLKIQISRKAIFPFIGCARSIEAVLNSVAWNVTDKKLAKHSALELQINFPRLYVDADRYGRMSINSANFALYISQQEVPTFITYLNHDISQVKEIANTFGEMYKEIYEEIKLKEVPNPVKKPFDATLFVVPNIAFEKGYKFFYASVDESGSSFGVKFFPLSYDTEQQIDYNEFSAVIHCQNTSKYPLIETVFPILCEKYIKMVRKELGLVQGNAESDIDRIVWKKE